MVVTAETFIKKLMLVLRRLHTHARFSCRWLLGTPFLSFALGDNSEYLFSAFSNLGIDEDISIVQDRGSGLQSRGHSSDFPHDALMLQVEFGRLEGDVAAGITFVFFCFLDWKRQQLLVVCKSDFGGILGGRSFNFLFKAKHNEATTATFCLGSARSDSVRSRGL
jgi:hypothetical protein